MHLAEQVVEHVAPMAQHVEDDAAAVLLAVVPRRALRRLPVALEHPVAELAAHREDAAEKAGVDQRLELEQAGKEELVLHHAVPDAGLLGGARDVERVLEGLGRRLLAIDVLARRDRLVQQLGAQLGRGGIEEQSVLGVLERGIEVGGPARRPRSPWPVARASPRCGRPGSDRASRVSPLRSATPPWARIATIERIRCWFMPMRPVTPFMMMPRRCCAISLLFLLPCISTDTETHRPRAPPPRRYSKPNSR